MLVKYHDDSAHNLFTTSCWSTFHSNAHTFTVKNTQNAYLNCLATSFVLIESLGSFSKWLYFLHNCISQTNTQIDIPIIQDNANNSILKLADAQNNIANTNVENNLENSISQKLKLSWNDTKIAAQTWSKLDHKKKNDIVFIIFDTSSEWKWLTASHSELKNNNKKIIIHVNNCIKSDNKITFFICHFFQSIQYLGKKYCKDSVSQRSL